MLPSWYKGKNEADFWVIFLAIKSTSLLYDKALFG